MQASAARITLAAAIGLFIVAGCSAAPPILTVPTATTLVLPTATAPGVPAPAAGQPLLPDPSAEYTVGDNIRFTAGDTDGDQADLTVLEAMILPPGAGSSAPRYAFLVELTGLDDIGFLYNILDFTLHDDQNFEYLPEFDGGQEPALHSGELTPGQKVRGWLTFEGPVASTFLDLQYAPELAIEQARIRVLVP